MSHTKEPWFCDEKGYIWRRHPNELYQNGGGVAGDKPLAICDKGWYGDGEQGYPNTENARRIVACVNACEGIDTDTLETEFKHLGAEYVEVIGLLEFSDKSLSDTKSERDTYRDLCAELLKAANDYLPYMPVSSVKKGGANIYSGMLLASDNLKDAIAKVVTILGDKNGR